MNHLAFFSAALCCMTAPICLAANLSPSNYAAEYKNFIAQLDAIQKDNSQDMYPALVTAFLATADERAGEIWMEQAAKDKHPVGLYYSSDLIMNSTVVCHYDTSRATKSYEMMAEAAKSGYIPALINESICLFTGQGVERDQATALRKLTEACKSGDNNARFTWLQMTERLTKLQDLERPEVKAEIERKNDLVILYASSLMTSVEEQLNYLRQAAELKNKDAIYALAQITAKSKPEDSYVLMQEAVRLHHANSIAIIGTLMSQKAEKGSLADIVGLKYNPVEGLAMIKIAAMLNSSLANLQLGEMYHTGSKDIKIDNERAFEHFRKAAYLNNPTASLTFAWMLMEGIGCKADPELGVEVCKRMMNSNLPQARMLLAYAYFKGLGVEEDGLMAADLLQEAAAQKLPQAYIFLAYITQKGCKGLTANKSRAESYVRMAALDMKDNAQKFYDKMLEDGDWIYRN